MASRIDASTRSCAVRWFVAASAMLWSVGVLAAPLPPFVPVLIFRGLYPRRVVGCAQPAAVETMSQVRSRLGPFAASAFAIYWSGGLVSNIGTWLQNVVGSVFVYERTGSALAVGLLNFATFAPMLLFSVFGGVISDRFDRRLVVVVTHLFSLAAASALAVLSVLGTLEPVHVVVTAFVLQTS